MTRDVTCDSGSYYSLESNVTQYHRDDSERNTQRIRFTKGEHSIWSRDIYATVWRQTADDLAVDLVYHNEQLSSQFERINNSLARQLSDTSCLAKPISNCQSLQQAKAHSETSHKL